MIVDRNVLVAAVVSIADEYSVSVSEIMSPVRRQNVVAARHKAIKFVYEAAYPTWSYSDIGAFFDRDHTSIMHALGLLERKPKLVKPRPKRISFSDLATSAPLVEKPVKILSVDEVVWGT